ncbi:MAG TPA: gephyrin-like molybdotransferase Glp [Methanoregulaceae archaeon]|nr:gephyrin-like molybdotransferase Glp [Methanoregulaceae archaeon]
MSLFLKAIPVDSAVRIVREISSPMPEEMVPIERSYDRVLARDIPADIDIPGFNRSVVDGYAVKSSDTAGAGESVPAMLHLTGMITMGTEAGLEIRRGECAYIPTGAELPGGADAAAMVEYCDSLGDQVLIKKAMAPGENVVCRGEDFASGENVLPKGRRLSVQDVGVLAAVGINEVPVRKKPRIGVISTGNELVEVSTIPTGGQVRDVNSYLCSSFLLSLGCEHTLYGIVKDDRDLLRAALRTATEECDGVIISGGSSKDDRDMSADLIGEIGEVMAHGIAISPGKPTIIGRSGEVPILGLPGHPASAFVVLLIIGRALISGMTGEENGRIVTNCAVLAQNIPSSKGREDYVRVRCKEGMAYPLFGKSGLLNTLVRSDGMIRVPAGSEGIETGEDVEVILW